MREEAKAGRREVRINLKVAMILNLSSQPSIAVPPALDIVAPSPPTLDLFLIPGTSIHHHHHQDLPLYCI